MKVDEYVESTDKDELLQEEKNRAEATGQANLNVPGRIDFGKNRSTRVWRRPFLGSRVVEGVVRERGEDGKTGDRGS